MWGISLLQYGCKLRFTTVWGGHNILNSHLTDPAFIRHRNVNQTEDSSERDKRQSGQPGILLFSFVVRNCLFNVSWNVRFPVVVDIGIDGLGILRMFVIT